MKSFLTVGNGICGVTRRMNIKSLRIIKMIGHICQMRFESPTPHHLYIKKCKLILRFSHTKYYLDSCPILKNSIPPIHHAHLPIDKIDRIFNLANIDSDLYISNKNRSRC